MGENRYILRSVRWDGLEGIIEDHVSILHRDLMTPQFFTIELFDGLVIDCAAKIHIGKTAVFAEGKSVWCLSNVGFLQYARQHSLCKNERTL